MNALAMGAGADEGLDRYLERMLEEAKLKQVGELTRSSQAETSRHNMADEANLAEYHKALIQDRNATERARQQNWEAEDQARKTTAGRALGESIPADTFLPETDPAVGMMQKGGVGSMLRPQEERPAVPEGPLMPGDTGEARLKGFRKQPSTIQSDKATDNARQQGQATETNRHNLADEEINRTKANKPPAPDRVLIQSGEGWMPRSDARTKLNNGETVPSPTTGSTRTMQEGAKMLQPHVDQIGRMAEDLDANGLFGPAMSRIRGLAEKAGTMDEFTALIGADPELNKDRKIGRFSTSLSLLASGAARVHYGGRAGSSPEAIRGFKAMVSDAATLNMFLGRLDAMNEFMSGYAAGPGGAEKPDQNSQGLPQIGGTFNGAKVLKVTPIK